MIRPGTGAGLPGGPADRALPRRRPGHGAADARAGHRLRRRPAGAQRAGAGGGVRAGRRALLAHRHGQDERPVEPDRPRRSLSVETTFDHDLRGEAALEAALAPLAEELAARVERAGFLGRTLTLKLRYADFAIASRRTTQRQPVRRPRGDPGGRRASCWRSGRGRPTPIRLLGLGVSSPADEAEPRQLRPAAHGSCAALRAELDSAGLLLARPGPRSGAPVPPAPTHGPAAAARSRSPTSPPISRKRKVTGCAASKARPRRPVGRPGGDTLAGDDHPVVEERRRWRSARCWPACGRRRGAVSISRSQTGSTVACAMTNSSRPPARRRAGAPRPAPPGAAAPGSAPGCAAAAGAGRDARPRPRPAARPRPPARRSAGAARCWAARSPASRAISTSALRAADPVAGERHRRRAASTRRRPDKHAATRPAAGGAARDAESSRYRCIGAPKARALMRRRRTSPACGRIAARASSSGCWRTWIS